MTAKTQTEDPEVTETEAETGEPEDDGGHSGLSLEVLDEKIDNLVKKVDRALRGGGGRRPASEGNADVADQVRSEVGKIREAEGREKARQDRIGVLEQKVQAITEAPPREYRRITKILWGEDED